MSALTDQGIDALRAALAAAAGVETLRDGAAVANQRHAALLHRSRAALRRASAAAAAGTPEEFVLADLHEARRCFDEITGARPHEEVLAAIFSRFCIGK